MKRYSLVWIVLILGIVMAACGVSGVSEITNEEAAVDVTEDEMVEVALPTPTKFEKYALPMGQTEEGAFFIGREDAPVTMIDYANYL